MQQIQVAHPFAEFIKILGKGKKGSRSLTQNEAYRAMNLILANAVEPIQLGAFLMLMRVKEETAEELAGFVTAARESFIIPKPHLSIDLDWSSYAGKRRHLPWFLLSTLLLAENGTRVFIHGAGGHTKGRIYTHQVLKYLNLSAAKSIEESLLQLEKNNFSYLSLEYFCPKLYEMINLRPLMGLRSPIHTLVRLLNPLSAKHSMQGIFHPAYRQIQQKTELLLKQTSVAVLKGEGGETERNPDTVCLVQSVKNNQLIEEQWPALFTRRHIKPAHLNPEQLALLWQGKIKDQYAEATIISTAAIALKLMAKANSQQQALDLATQYWQCRLAIKS